MNIDRNEVKYIFTGNFRYRWHCSTFRNCHSISSSRNVCSKTVIYILFMTEDMPLVFKSVILTMRWKNHAEGKIGPLPTMAMSRNQTVLLIRGTSILFSKVCWRQLRLTRFIMMKMTTQTCWKNSSKNTRKSQGRVPRKGQARRGEAVRMRKTWFKFRQKPRLNLSAASGGSGSLRREAKRKKNQQPRLPPPIPRLPHEDRELYHSTQTRVRESLSKV